jgi:hypothetical protein
MEFGVCDALLHFNIGRLAVIGLYNSMMFIPGKYIEVACQAEDKFRVALAEYKSTRKAKARRTQVCSGIILEVLSDKLCYI